jgi:hypothetical protein
VSFFTSGSFSLTYLSLEIRLKDPPVVQIAGSSKSHEGFGGAAKGKGKEQQMAAGVELERRNVRVGALGLEIEILEARKEIIDWQIAMMREEIEELRNM